MSIIIEQSFLNKKRKSAAGIKSGLLNPAKNLLPQNEIYRA